MSFFGRAANLVKGGMKSLTRSGDGVDRERILEEELAKTRVGSPAPVNAGVASKAAPKEPVKPEVERRAPERDEHGNVKRTL